MSVCAKAGKAARAMQAIVVWWIGNLEAMDSLLVQIVAIVAGVNTEVWRRLESGENLLDLDFRRTTHTPSNISRSFCLTNNSCGLVPRTASHARIFLTVTVCSVEGAITRTASTVAGPNTTSVKPVRRNSASAKTHAS